MGQFLHFLESSVILNFYFRISIRGKFTRKRKHFSLQSYQLRLIVTTRNVHSLEQEYEARFFARNPRLVPSHC